MPIKIPIPAPDNYMVRCEKLVKIYKSAKSEVHALRGLDLKVEKGELMAIIGSSGSGKSTVLNMLGGLDVPTSGELFIDGRNMLKMAEDDYIRFKRNTVGFVWQNNARNLVPYLSAIENVEMPLLLTNHPKRKERARELLDMVGLSHREKSKLDQLSGGEQQRVAIAIALSNSPKMLLADEPTGSVDSKTSNNIMEVFRTLNREMKVTVIIVTHDNSLAKSIDHVVRIKDGVAVGAFN